MRLTLAVLLLTSSICWSQNESVSDSKTTLPEYTLKIGIWPLINVGKTAIDLGTEKRITDHFSVDLEVGYYLDSHNFANEDGETYHGWRVRPGVKWDVGGINMGLLYKYENVDNKMYQRVLRQGGAYIQDYLMDRKVLIHGFQLRLERAFPLSRDGKWIIEPFLRFGIQYVNVNLKIPKDAQIIDNDTFTTAFREGNSTRPDFYIGVNIGLAWW